MPSAPLRVLVVDDDAGIRRLLKRILGADGLHVVTAEDGEAALAALQAQQFDLVILDWMLPGMDGSVVLKHLRADARTALIPVLVLSAWITVDAAGADLTMAKPFKLEDLWAAITHLVATRVVPR